jgi:hypothetical protein
MPSSTRWLPAEIRKVQDNVFIDWISREDARFTEPFYRQTLSRLNGVARTKTTPLDELLKYTKMENLPAPQGFIFHLSRCGSTLVSQMLAKDPENLVISEPGLPELVLNDHGQSPVTRLAHSVGFIKALTSAKLDDEKRIFIKYGGSTSWIPWLRTVYPETPWIFIYRRPSEVLHSNLSTPPPWLKDVKAEDHTQNLIAELELRLEDLLSNYRDASMLVNYTDILKHDFLPKLLNVFGIEKTDSEMRKRMLDAHQWYSKENEVLWADRGNHAESVPDDFYPGIEKLNAQYAELEKLRL